MASSSEIGLAATINILTAFAFLVAFAILRIQPINDRVYFPKWYLRGLRSNPLQSGAFVQKFVNLDFRSYLKFLNWMPAALRMPEPELIDHAGLDSVLYLRIYLTGYSSTSPYFVYNFYQMQLRILISVLDLLFIIDIRLKIFVPIACLAFSVMVPVNFTNRTLEESKLTYSDIDKLSISNIPTGSNR